ncbi:MAG: hypothetical protein QX197_09105 [Methylococcaceae bacterium]
MNMNKQLSVFTFLLAMTNTIMADIIEEPATLTESPEVLQTNDADLMPLITQIQQISGQLHNQNKRAKATNQTNYNSDKSKIEALLGEIKVTHDNTTDIIQVNEVKQDSTLGYAGKDSTHYTVCTYQSFKDFDLPVNSQFDYICVNVSPFMGTIVQSYFFNLDGNTITKGGYVKGDEYASAGALVFGTLKPLTGYKVAQFGRYQSDYQNISWVASNDSDYCLDITDEKWVIYPGFQALQCGKGFQQFSPANYVRDVMRSSLPNGFKFNWRVWSRNAQGKTTYGGNGFEGKVVVTQ